MDHLRHAMQGFYRNHMEEVIKFFETHHKVTKYCFFFAFPTLSYSLFQRYDIVISYSLRIWSHLLTSSFSVWGSWSEFWHFENNVFHFVLTGTPVDVEAFWCWFCSSMLWDVMSEKVLLRTAIWKNNYSLFRFVCHC